MSSLHVPQTIVAPSWQAAIVNQGVSNTSGWQQSNLNSHEAPSTVYCPAASQPTLYERLPSDVEHHRFLCPSPYQLADSGFLGTPGLGETARDYSNLSPGPALGIEMDGGANASVTPANNPTAPWDIPLLPDDVSTATYNAGHDSVYPWPPPAAPSPLQTRAAYASESTMAPLQNPVWGQCQLRESSAHPAFGVMETGDTGSIGSQSSYMAQSTHLTDVRRSATVPNSQDEQIADPGSRNRRVHRASVSTSSRTKVTKSRSTVRRSRAGDSNNTARTEPGEKVEKEVARLLGYITTPNFTKPGTMDAPSFAQIRGIREEVQSRFPTSLGSILKGGGLDSEPELKAYLRSKVTSRITVRSLFSKGASGKRTFDAEKMALLERVADAMINELHLQGAECTDRESKVEALMTACKIKKGEESESLRPIAVQHFLRLAELSSEDEVD